MVFTVLVNIVLCPFSHILVPIDTSFYVLVQDVSLSIGCGLDSGASGIIKITSTISPLRGLYR
jgi:hypothetical protein